MEVSKLLDIIRIKLDDFLFNDSDDDALFKTDELVYYINNALREAVFRGKLLVRHSDTINLLTGISEYNVPSGIVNITQILDENNKQVSKIQEVDLNQKIFNAYSDDFGIYNDDWRNDTSDLPYGFMQNTTTNKLVFYPIPSKDSIVTIRGTYLSDELDSSDELPAELSEIYQPDLIYWVLYEAFDKPDADTYNPTAAEKNKKRFTEVFGEKLTANQFQEMLAFPDDPGSLRDY